MADSGTPVPLTEFQRRVLADLAPSDDRYLAGSAAMHFVPNSARYSDHLDLFHDSETRVATAFSADRGGGSLRGSPARR